MITAIVLAAGVSARFGDEIKQLVYVGKKRMIEQVITTLVESDVDEIIVVLGYQAEKIKEVLIDYDVRFCYNPDYQQGQSTSLVAGLEEVDDETTGILCMLGDLPLVKKETINQLISEFKSGEELIVVPEYKEQRGNPVIFARKLKKEMLEVRGDKGARDLLVKYQTKVNEVLVDDSGVSFDIDTKADYERLMKVIRDQFVDS
ncbi:nucleotidyltransferase family protein [Natroniella sulfidigena]|uniref:nucleotidyltransferase family protein n=1 Tax=Natroniella sulfidigena TaxID=723921 RepID=UPI002009E0A7|nr:nucleotidyltransferase family protein [Natroniella sulfidigena]